MNVNRSFLEDGNINPSLYNLLDTVKDDDILLHHKEHSQMHPMAMYNKSISRLFLSINNLIDFMENQRDTKKYLNNDELFIRTKELIESIIAFKDDTFQIIKCFYPKCAYISKKGKREPVFADKWLDSINPKLIEELKKNLKFLNNLNIINNKVKHNNGRFSFFQINAMSHFFVIGLFLDGVDEKDAKIPDKSVHPRFKNMHTGYSYNYLIPLVFSYIYLISDYACLTIKDIIKDYYGKELIVNKINDKSEEVICLINKINKFTTNIILPDEYKREFPLVYIINEELKIEYPVGDTLKMKFLKYSDYKGHLIISGDGFTKSYQLPYF